MTWPALPRGVPAAVRLGAVGVTLLLAVLELVVAPGPLVAAAGGVALVLALAAGLAPRGVLPLVVVVALLAEHLLATAATSPGRRVGLALAATALLWLLHQLHALAALLPPRCVVDPAVLHVWARRTLVGAAQALPLALAVLAVAGAAPARGVFPWVGALAALLLLLLPLRVLGRR